MLIINRLMLLRHHHRVIALVSQSRLISNHGTTLPDFQDINNEGIDLPTNSNSKVPETSEATKSKRSHANRLSKSKLLSFLTVCVDNGLLKKATSTLVTDRKYILPCVDVSHYNTVIYGWAQIGDLRMVEYLRSTMKRFKVSENEQTYANVLLCLSKCNPRTTSVKPILEEMQEKGLDLRNIFQTGYIKIEDRNNIKDLIRLVVPEYDDTFVQVPHDKNCKLLHNFDRKPELEYDIGGLPKLNHLIDMGQSQLALESRVNYKIDSIIRRTYTDEEIKVNLGLWKAYVRLWREKLTTAVNHDLDLVKETSLTSKALDLYPYLVCIDRNLVVELLLDEVEMETNTYVLTRSSKILHTNLGNKIMNTYMSKNSKARGITEERQMLYDIYLRDYCKTPFRAGLMNSREFLQKQASKLKNYAIYSDLMNPSPVWPEKIITAVGKFYWGILFREIKFDPKSVKRPSQGINKDNLISAYYTAYVQNEQSYGIWEELRTRKDFEILRKQCSAFKLRFSCLQLPMSSPPMPWLSYDTGGYLNTNVGLVRQAQNESYAVTSKSFDRQKLYPTLDSLNAISLCPWIVNKDILDLAVQVFINGGDMSLTIPLHESRMLDKAPTLESEPSKAAKIIYEREKSLYDQKCREMYSLWCDCLYRLSIANHNRNKMFWFPHNIDFRGRTYPIPPHFNHLGADLARALLLFAKGKPLGARGLDWLKIHVINLTGTMKSHPVEERLQYANSIMHSNIIDSADNPWDGTKWWTNSENPWQVLACCKEIAKAIRSGDLETYESHFPIHQDGSCNGLQHYAALGRDPDGAKSVNLEPSERPQDVYMRIVELVEKQRAADAAKGSELAQLLEGHIQRKVIKQTVMTTVYGVTIYGARVQIARQLDSRGFPSGSAWRASNYLARITFESIGNVFRKSMKIQKWLNNCASTISKDFDSNVVWETPMNLRVSQPYAKITSRLEPSENIVLPPHSVKMLKPNTLKQKTAFPPNFIHSLDSTHMMLTALHCQAAGITFASVHDCFWTHPTNVDDMNKICREQFVALHSEPLLDNLSKQFMKRYANRIRQSDAKTLSTNGKPGAPTIDHSEIFRRIPDKGDFDVRRVLDSTYFFS